MRLLGRHPHKIRERVDKPLDPGTGPGPLAIFGGGIARIGIRGRERGLVEGVGVGVVLASRAGGPGAKVRGCRHANEGMG